MKYSQNVSTFISGTLIILYLSIGFIPNLSAVDKIAPLSLIEIPKTLDKESLSFNWSPTVLQSNKLGDIFPLPGLDFSCGFLQRQMVLDFQSPAQ